MVTTLDVFTTVDAFTTRELTDSINKIPALPMQLTMQNLFEEKGVPGSLVFVEQKNGTLTLIPNTLRGGPETANVRDLRDAIPFTIPHLPVTDRIYATELMDLRPFGGEGLVSNVDDAVAERMMKMSNALDLTNENHRRGAVKGIVLDADGTTVIFNLFTEFNVTQATEVDFDLDNATPASGAVVLVCADVVTQIRDALGGVPFLGVSGMCGQTFFRELVAHTEVRTAYERWMAIASNAMMVGTGASGQMGDFLRMGHVGQGFPYGGIFFWENSELVGSTGQVAVEATKAHFYPVGVPGLFVTRFGVADFIEAQGSMGLPRYAKIGIPEQFGRFVDVHAQTNPLNICTRPEVLIPGRNT